MTARPNSQINIWFWHFQFIKEYFTHILVIMLSCVEQENW